MRITASGLMELLPMTLNSLVQNKDGVQTIV
mgnify:CR=1 FL=1